MFVIYIWMVLYIPLPFSVSSFTMCLWHCVSKLGSVSSPMCVWNLENVYSQTQLCQIGLFSG